MLFDHRTVAFTTLFTILANGLPLDAPLPRDIVPRQKSYAVVNVDGGATTAAPQVTTIIKTTETIEVVNPAPTTTNDSSSAKSTSVTSTSSTPVQTPKPIFVTVTVPNDDGPTEYYDNGLWHTSYRVKTFAAAVTTPVPSILPSFATSLIIEVAPEPTASV